jgi:hypothetical protein
MPQATPNGDNRESLNVQIDDEQYAELSELAGQALVHVSVWEESLADALNQGHAGAPTQAEDDLAADLDLYLRDGVYFELYGTLCYTDPEQAPLNNLNEIESRLRNLIKRGGELLEVAVDEDDGLVLVLGSEGQPSFYLQVGAWLLDEWEELPDDAAS